MKGRSCGLFLCLFLGIACFSGYQVLRILHEYRVGADAYFKLEQFASLPPASEETEETPAELAWPEVDFTALAAVNPDVTAWLYGPDTGISYPVVQGTDNDYYLDHLLDGTANSAGCLFVDTSCRPDFFWPQHGDLRPSDEKTALCLPPWGIIRSRSTMTPTRFFCW